MWVGPRRFPRGGLEPARWTLRPGAGGRVSRVTAAVREWIREQIRRQPDITFAELQERLERAQRLHLSVGWLWVVVRQLGLRLKKSRSTPQEQDSEPAQQRRQAWRDAVASIEIERLVFLDESGATTQMTRTWGRAPRGERVREATPQSHWQTLTIFAALTTRGLQAPMTIPEADRRRHFPGLCGAGLVSLPPPRPGGDHGQPFRPQSRRSTGADRSGGGRLLYLPPYSPDLNPIEQAWSKVKQILRSLKARTAEALESAVAEALNAITAENAIAWFSHCGYGLHPL